MAFVFVFHLVFKALTLKKAKIKRLLSEVNIPCDYCRFHLKSITSCLKTPGGGGTPIYEVCAAVKAVVFSEFTLE